MKTIEIFALATVTGGTPKMIGDGNQPNHFVGNGLTASRLEGGRLIVRLPGGPVVLGSAQKGAMPE
jgi:hypothetical protein